jgi:vacuolar-type H+-ATPase subunit F/Vma7
MGRIAVIGEPHRIQALTIGGAQAHPAQTPEEVLAAWAAITPDVAVLILTREAAGILEGRTDGRRDLLITVMP